MALITGTNKHEYLPTIKRERRPVVTPNKS
jgi:hypothetical protein